MKEAALYPGVERWLKRTHGCFKTAINRGLAYSRIDVVGVKDVGGDLSGDLEVIAVEVKRGTEPFATASGQASGYKVYANRVYLADVRREGFHPEEIAIASHLGIGLIRISGRRCTEVLSSPSYAPIPKLSLLLLEHLGLGECALCRSFFSLGTDGRKFSAVTRENVRRALKNDLGVMFWNYAVGSRKKRTRASAVTGRVPGAADTYERRFLCPDCLSFLGTLSAESTGHR